jgi:hypothetical protein
MKRKQMKKRSLPKGMYELYVKGRKTPLIVQLKAIPMQLNYLINQLRRLILKKVTISFMLFVFGWLFTQLSAQITGTMQVTKQQNSLGQIGPKSARILTSVIVRPMSIRKNSRSY